MAKISIDDILRQEGISATIEAADGTSAKSMKCDFFVTTKQFAEKMEGVDAPVVVVSNLVNKEELKEKMMPVIQNIQST